MTIRDFQQYLGDMARFLEAGKAAGVAKDFAAMRAGLEPFADLTIAKFSDFLPIVEDYYRRGELPGTVKPKSPPRQRAPKPGAVDVEGLVRRIQDLFERASDPATTIEEIRAAGEDLKKLKKPDLQRVAAAIELTQKFKTNGDLVKGIIDRIEKRRNAVSRSYL
jgi:hypothetical protein